MPEFLYEALNDAGKPQRGTVEAETSEHAIARIRSFGLFPTSVREAKKKKKKKDRGNPFEEEISDTSKKRFGVITNGDVVITIIGLTIMGILIFLAGFALGGGFTS